MQKENAKAAKVNVTEKGGSSAQKQRLKIGPATGPAINMDDLKKQFAIHDATHNTALVIPGAAHQ
jgi:hypothetical protein